VSIRWRFALLNLVLTLVPAGAQISAEHPFYPTPARNAPTWENEPPEIYLHPRESGGSVSIEELRRPLQGDGLRRIRKAQELLRSGDRNRALELLRNAMQIEAARPYALSLLGTEHLRMGLVDEALPELEEATRLLPGNAANHNNLSFALGWKGDHARAMTEARKALQLEPGNPKARFILGALLWAAGAEKEALYHLKMAAPRNDGAKNLLAKLQSLQP
jgi:tetratricopeptide (TPR) repeat protein